MLDREAQATTRSGQIGAPCIIGHKNAEHASLHVPGVEKSTAAVPVVNDTAVLRSSRFFLVDL